MVSTFGLRRLLAYWFLRPGRVAAGWLRLVVLITVLLFSLQAARAQAPSPLTLNWVRGDGAESCMSGKELEAKLREALEADNVAAAALTIEGWVQRDERRAQWTARLRVLNADEATIGMRELSSHEASCDALTPSIVLVLAILVELGSETKRAPSDSHAVPTPVVCAASAPPLVKPSTQQPSADAPKPSTASWQVEALAALTLAVGLLPGASIGPQLGVRLRSPWPFSLLLRGGYWPGGRESITTHSGAPPASIDFSAYHGDLSVCLSLPRPGPWWLAGCWGAALGARRADVSGLSDATDSVRGYAAATGSAQFGYAVSKRLSLSLDTSFLGFGREDTYSYEDTRGVRHEVFHAGRFAGLFALGLGVKL